MSASHSTRARRSAQPNSLKDSEQGDHLKSLQQQRTDAMEAELRNSNGSLKANQQLEIPTLDDMTSYLLSNEVMDKDNFSHYLPTQQKQSYEIPPMNPRENEYDKSQTLSIKTREKNEPSFNQFNAEEGKKEIERLFKMAQSLASNGDYQQAINYYNRIVGLNEKSGSAWIAMGHCFAMMGHDQKALNSYQQALKSAPLCQKDEQLWYGIGLLYQKFEDWNNAETSFRNALRLEPIPNLKGEILYNLAMVMKAKGDYPEAIKVFTNAILSEAFPPEKIVEILCLNGSMQEKMDDVDGALQTYKYALLVQENNPRALLCAGWLCFQLDQFEQALGYLTKAEMIMPNDANITYVIARCNLKMKQHTTAYDCLHKCLSKEATNSIYWSSLGILFAELMQLKQAYDCLSKALRNDPKIPEHFFNLGCLFELSNQQKDALSMYDKALEAHPNFSLALIRKRKILSDSQSSTLEVQFKHPPFVLPISQDLKKEKPLFTFALMGQLSPFTASGSKGMNESGKSNGSRAVSSNERNSQANQNQERKLQQISQRDIIPDQSLLSKANQFENHKITLDNRSKNPKVPIGGLDQEMNGLKMSRPLISEPSATKLPSVQSLNSSLAGLNSFSVVQNTFNNESKNQGHTESEEMNPLAPGRAKTEELLSMVKNLSPDFAKQLNGLQAVIAKNNNILQSNLLQNLNVEGLKPTKNISSPIVLKHNPQVLTLNESTKKSVTQQQSAGNGAQNKELKLTHKLNRSDDEEDIGVQKKIKTDNINKDEVIPSIGN